MHYRIGVVGLGSIGTRHIRNIVNELNNRGDSFSIDLIRTGKGDLSVAEDIRHCIKTTYLYDDQITAKYDVVFITNPTHLHYDAMQRFSGLTAHMFIEKPIFHTSRLDVDELELKSGNIYYVACPLRYSNVVQHIKKTMDTGAVFSVRAICSSYLPDWRPNQDYRATYSAHKDQGGGVSIDLIHEWDYLSYLFGMPKSVHKLSGKFSHLEIDSDDLAVYIARYESMCLELHLDYFGRKRMRQVQIFTCDETISGDLINETVSYTRLNENMVFEPDGRDIFQREMERFFNILEGKAANENDVRHALKILKIAAEE